MTSNPLLIREKHRSTKLAVYSALKYSFSASLVITIISLVGLVYYDRASYDIGTMLVLFSLIVVAVPPFVAYAAAIRTVNDRRNNQYELLHITILSNGRLIEGYILSVLYRVRGFLAVIIGFAPWAVIWGVYMSIYNCSRAAFVMSPLCQPVSAAFVFISLLSFISFGINVAGVDLLGIALGVFLGVWWGNRFLSSMAALLLTLITMTYLIFASVNFSGAELLQRNLLFLPGLYLSCGLLMLLARPLARKTA